MPALISCRQMTSGVSRSMKSCSSACRARMPFTFQVAIFISGRVHAIAHGGHTARAEDYDRRAVINIGRSVACVLALIFVGAAAPRTQSPLAAVTSPKAQFGFDIGDDYVLANYTQIEAYWKKLDAESDRLSLVDIGRSEEGRTQWMAIVSAPENIRALDRYKEISRRLARAETLGDDQARALAAAGKAIVWIDGELVHARAGAGEADARRSAAPLPEVRRARRQPRLLHVHAGGDDQHEPRPLQGVVPPDRLRP